MLAQILLYFFIIIVIPHICTGQETPSSSSAPLQASGVVVPSNKKWDIQSRTSYLQARQNQLVMFETEIVYSINKYIGLDMDFFTVLLNKQGPRRSYGISDTFMSLTINLTTEETLTTNVKIGMKLPTGDADKSPPTGTGSTDFFGEISLNHTSRRWYFSTKLDALIAGNFHNRKNGNTYLQEIDFGLRFQTSDNHPSNIYLLWELVTEYGAQDILDDFPDTNSGGFLLRTGPRFGWEKEDLVQIQFHFNVPISHEPNGNQPVIEFRTEFLFEIRF